MASTARNNRSEAIRRNSVSTCAASEDEAKAEARVAAPPSELGSSAACRVPLSGAGSGMSRTSGGGSGVKLTFARSAR